MTATFRPGNLDRQLGDSNQVTQSGACFPQRSQHQPEKYFPFHVRSSVLLCAPPGFLAGPVEHFPSQPGAACRMTLLMNNAQWIWSPTTRAVQPKKQHNKKKKAS